MRRDGRVSSSLPNLCTLIQVLNSKVLQHLMILNYKNANDTELFGLALELVENSNDGIQVRVLKDSNVVSCVSVTALEECSVDESQECDCYK